MHKQHRGHVEHKTGASTLRCPRTVHTPSPTSARSTRTHTHCKPRNTPQHPRHLKTLPPSDTPDKQHLLPSSAEASGQEGVSRTHPLLHTNADNPLMRV
jgi:hypothetical protein